MQRVMLAILISASTALRVPVGVNQKSVSPKVSRRSLLALPVAALAVGGHDISPASAAPPLDEIKILGSKAKGIKSYVRTTSGNRRKFPMEEGGNNYVNVINNLERGKKEVLLPLQAAMATYAKTATLADPELQKELKLQASYMKGHLLELDQAIKERKFDEYTSKTTGDVYPGGKAERELEEVCETFGDFLLIASGKPAPQRDGTQ